ncbi:hypothetical protein GpartN1_g855.t1 [Galdieria partita]|uniref:Uncharacterized protein n=1 Tax=Galdieria partita TaxID=83374 RepID=A0A9C7PRT9_9RHOD|nr:hypothetical protein GpartN1_g855.t1 [Galdieria partita]
MDNNVSYQSPCAMFIMAVPFAEKARVICYLECEVSPNSILDGVDSLSSFKLQPLLRFSNSGKDRCPELAAFMELPFSKAALCGKSLSSSVGFTNYIWYSCGLEVEQNRRKPVYHNLTVGMYYRGMVTHGWIASAQRIVSLIARSLALEEIRCGYVTRQSILPSGEERDLENILKSALTCVVCEIPGKILVNRYLEVNIHRQYLSEDYNWNEYSLCFFISSEKSIDDMFYFPYAKILSLLFRLWDPSKCLIEIVRNCMIDFDKSFIIEAIQKGRAHHMTEYVGVLKKSLHFLVHETAKNRVENLWSKISKIHDTLLIDLLTIEESFRVLQMLSKGYTIAQILSCFDSKFERVVCRYIAILEFMQVIDRI